MINDEVQHLILNYLYNKWLDNVFSLDCLKELSESEFNVEEKILLANARYLADKFLINEPRTLSFCTRITILGVNIVESKQLSVDLKKRITLLKLLEDKYDEYPNRSMNKGTLIKELGYTEVEAERIVWYLGEIGYAEVSWSGGKNFWIKISDLGLDAMRRPSLLEQESVVMANAYSLLYKLENELRIYYEMTLREQFGDKWWDKGVSSEIKDKAETKKKLAYSKEKGNYSIIFYTDFEDLRILPNKKWKLFEPTLKTQSGVLSRLGELEPIRNKIAHSRFLTTDEISTLELFYKQIIEMLP